MKRLKVINGYAENARVGIHLCKRVGYIPRQKQIPSPYAYSPTHVVYLWKGQNVIQVEVSHRRYEVFAVPSEMIRKTEKEIFNEQSLTSTSKP